MEVHLTVIGILLILLAVMHVGFPRHFNWKEELPKLSMINREMMVVHYVFIALLLLLMGLLCVTSAQDLVYTPLGRRVSLGLGIFWAVRLATQFLGYSSSLWKGKSFETVIHVVFTILWVYCTVVFFLVSIN